MQLPIFRRVKAHAPCPACAMHNDVDLTQCRHCGRTFSEADRKQIQEYADAQRAKGGRMGIIVGLVLLAVLLMAQLSGA